MTIGTHRRKAQPRRENTILDGTSQALILLHPEYACTTAEAIRYLRRMGVKI